MDNDYKLKAIEWWQTAGYFHPLTCATSSHKVLVGFIDDNDVKLKCIDCLYVQNYIPDAVFSVYRDRHKFEGA